VSAPSTRGRRGFRSLTVSAVGVGVLAAATLTGAARTDSPARANAPIAAMPAAATPAVPANNNPGKPPSLLHSTYLGGQFWDEAVDVKAGADGSTYVAGFTVSPNFPVRNAAQGAFHGIVDAFVAKLAPGGRSLLWSTYLGGNDMDVATGLAVDKNGNAYVTGRTDSVDFPTTGGTFQPAIRGRSCQQGEPCHDAFVTKLSSNGQIRFSTLLGGNANEEPAGIAVDSSGNVYVTGNTDSHNFPTRRAVQSTLRSSPCENDESDLPCPYDAFLSKLTPDGRGLAYSTYLGGAGLEQSGGVAVDSAGSAYVTGTTRSVNFPIVGGLGRPLRVRSCGPPPGEPCLDAYVTKFAADGGHLVYSTFLGGTKNERGSGIAVDSAGSAIVTGSTSSPDFPTQHALQGHIDNSSCTREEPEEKCDDGFVSKLTPGGRGLVYSTYLGGKAEDQGLSLTVDKQGNAYVGGRTDSRNFRTRSAVQPKFGGYIDGFASSLTPAGDLRWSTFFGGKEADRVEGIAVDPNQRVRLAGRTLSPNFPTRHPIQAALHDEDYDAFVAGLG
jgi:hypothetical protein